MTRVAAGARRLLPIALTAVCTLDAAVMLSQAWRAHAAPRMFSADERYGELRDALSGVAVAGFIADHSPPEISARFFLAQHALAPTVLRNLSYVPAPELPLAPGDRIVLDLARAQDVDRLLTSARLRVIRAASSGVLVASKE
ncbi:MAG: hypothetical protein U1E76_19375 [Planctomycetota bacterium]